MDKQKFAEKHQISIDDVEYLTRNTSLYCKCGEFKGLTNSKQSRIGKILKSTCGNKECSHLYGKKRPEHSIKMRQLAEDPNSKLQNSLIKKGELKNVDLNTPKFKSTVLSNLGIKHNDNDLEEVYYDYLSKRSKSRRHKIKSTISRFHNQLNDELKLLAEELCMIHDFDFDTFETFSDSELSRIFSIVHGLGSVQNSINGMSTRNSFFKTEKITGLKHNREGLTSVILRSGWEADTVRIFENNEIRWSYETLRIPTIRKDGIYVPDFLIEYQGEIILLEIKGTFYNRNETDYMANKVLAGIRYAEKNQYKFLFLTKQPKNLRTILQSQELAHGISRTS